MTNSELANYKALRMSHANVRSDVLAYLVMQRYAITVDWLNTFVTCAGTLELWSLNNLALLYATLLTYEPYCSLAM